MHSETLSISLLMLLLISLGLRPLCFVLRSFHLLFARFLFHDSPALLIPILLPSFPFPSFFLVACLLMLCLRRSLQLAEALRSNPYHADMLLGGFDEGKGPSLFFLDYLASMHPVDKAAHGYASYFVSRFVVRSTRLSGSLLLL